MAIVFGLAEFQGVVTGLTLQTVTIGETASEAEALGEDGVIEQIDVFGKKRTINFTGNVQADGDISALTVGGKLTVNGDEYTLNSVEISTTVNGHRSCTGSGVAPMKA